MPDFGTAGRNRMQEDGIFSWDIGSQKSFYPTEGTTVPAAKLRTPRPNQGSRAETLPGLGTSPIDEPSGFAASLALGGHALV